MSRKLRKDEYLDDDRSVRRESDSSTRAFKKMDSKGKKTAKDVMGW